MQRQNLLTRDDTLLGICEGLGEDLRINSNLIRLGFAGALFFSPMAAIGTYLALGLLVALTRLLVPSPTPETVAASVTTDAPVVPAKPNLADNDAEAGELLAA